MGKQCPAQSTLSSASRNDAISIADGKFNARLVFSRFRIKKNNLHPLEQCASFRFHVICIRGVSSMRFSRANLSHFLLDALPKHDSQFKPSDLESHRALLTLIHQLHSERAATRVRHSRTMMGKGV